MKNRSFKDITLINSSKTSNFFVNFRKKLKFRQNFLQLIRKFSDNDNIMKKQNNFKVFPLKIQILQFLTSLMHYSHYMQPNIHIIHTLVTSTK